MIVDKAVYADGQRHECQDLASGLAAARDLGGSAFVWVGLHEPTVSELEQIADLVDMHPLAAEDVLTGRQRPKLDVFGDSALLVLRTLAYFESGSDVETGEVIVAWGDHWVLTVRHGKVARLDGVRARLERSPDLMAHGPASALFVVADHIVDNYTAVDHELNDDVLRVEQSTFRPDRQVDVTEIYELKREVLEARRAIHPLVDPVRQLINGPRLVPEGLEHYLRDVQDHLLRADEHVTAHDQALTDILQAHLAMVSVQQGADARKISAWAALAAVPTIVGAVYGMNFDHMPELHWVWGYPVAMVVTVVVVVFLYLRLKRSGWL